VTDPTDDAEVTVHDTPLVDRHLALGARIIDFAGWRMPVQYTSILGEHRAVRERAGLFDLSHMGELWVEGPDAASALDAAVVSAPSRLAVGRAQYSMIVAPDGGILDDLIIYRLADERFMVVANASNAGVVSDTLAERLDGTRAVLDDHSLATGLVAIQGPRSIDILRPLTDVDLDALRYYAIAGGRVGGIEAQVARTGYTGEDGFEVFVETGRTGELWTRCSRPCVRRAVCPSGWARATPFGWRPACRSTATSSTAPRRRSTPGSGGSSSSTSRATSWAGRPSRRSPPTVRANASSDWSWRVAASPGTGTRSTPATSGRGRSRAGPSRRPSVRPSPWPS
jgi:hypothetical protein